jgi:three-Cys-motif partner protein
MDYYIDENGVMHDNVRYHTRKKHKFIESYLNIWSDNVKRNPPTLDIFDLYASTGKCYCEDAEMFGLPEATWDGSALLSARCLKKYANGKNLFLNTYADTPENCERQKGNLERLLSDMGFNNRHKISTEPIESAVETAISYIRDIRFPTLWILDPHAISELPWSVVERIAKLKGEYHYKGEDRIRKPELIISLMTEDFQRWYKNHPRLISIALGEEEGSWKPMIEELIGEGYNTREAFILYYMQKLSELYDKDPILIEINITNQTAIVYCMLLLTESDAGHYLSQLELIPEFENWVASVWKDGAKKIILEKGLKKKGQLHLTDDY